MVKPLRPVERRESGLSLTSMDCRNGRFWFYDVLHHVAALLCFALLCSAMARRWRGETGNMKIGRDGAA
ncbi:hypothetical protein WN982_22315 [Paraburkholderia sp. IMGN_8]|uniref:hypothetical protein n=1 Tax=Paraburkholderia sp. IMGN_8 TaxID=3136564 RepID=UPI0031013317